MTERYDPRREWADEYPLPPVGEPLGKIIGRLLDSLTPANCGTGDTVMVAGGSAMVTVPIAPWRTV